MIAWAVLRAAAIGVPLGALTGMPLGVINIAIVDAATAGRRRFAVGLGLGGGAADAVHAMLGFGGVGRVVTDDPELVRVLAIAATVVILAYAVFAWRYRRRPGAATRDDQPGQVRVLHGAATGFLLTAPNPAALGAWVALAAAVWPHAAFFEAAGLAAGVCTGSMLWFSSLARWISRVRPDHPLLTVIPRVALVLLVASALVGAYRAL